MEMISSPNWLALGMFAGAIVASLIVARWLPLLWVRNREIAARDLADPATRLDLQQVLARANVGGSADIRDGVVQPAPNLAHEHPVVRLADAAVADFYRRATNPNAQMLYWRDPATGQYALFGGFDVECVSEVVALVTRKESA